MLVAGNKNQFLGLKTNNLFQREEAAVTMLNRIVKESPISFDSKSRSPPNATASPRQSLSPFKRKRPKPESPGKTFALTQGSTIEGPSPISRSSTQPPTKKNNDKR